VRLDELEPATRRERLGIDATIRASGCIPADELTALRNQVLPAARSAAVAEHLVACATCRDFLSVVDRPAAEPDRVGRYLIRHRLGAGGMGVVYEAVDPNLDRRVAIKLVRPEHLGDDARRRLVREARALAKISHPNVVTVHDVGEHDDQVFVATELVEGETMASWQIGRDWRALIDAWIQVARGLSAAHAGGIVHRDVKPSNVFVGRDGRVRIGDFGIARDHAGGAIESAAGRTVIIGPLTATGAVAGTPGYMAPEQLRGALDARSDQFALCVAVVEGLTEARPQAGTAPLLPGVPETLRAVLVRGLAADPDARFATMAELAEALTAVLEVPATAPVPGRRRAWIARVAAVAGVAITAAVVAALIARPNAPRAASVTVAAPAALAKAVAVVPAASGPFSGAHAWPSLADGSAARGPFDSAPDGRSPKRPMLKRAPVRPSDDTAPATVEALLAQAKAFERASQWAEARVLYQRLENMKGHRAEALYRQAWTAFQMNDTTSAMRLAGEAATEPGAFQTPARFLYGDALYRQLEYARAKAIYLHLRAGLRGDYRATATKKIAVCNRALQLPDADGIAD